jgi:hypothetical protein
MSEVKMVYSVYYSCLGYFSASLNNTTLSERERFRGGNKPEMIKE